MLFNSLLFLFGFLPVTAIIFYLLSQRSGVFAALWLVAASLFFYGWWNASFVLLLLGSAIFNYAAGYLVNPLSNFGRWRRRGTALGFAIGANLAVLAYYKYSGFFEQILQSETGTIYHIWPGILPLGISFFTFTQIGYIVDCFQGRVQRRGLLYYLLFVTYFPHLIAGPILHHEQVMPQFSTPRTYRLDWSNIAVGLTMLLIGLTKKVVLADTFAAFATPIFLAAQQGAHPPLVEAWTGALAYTLQIYFDFSGYSDMAIGISLFFNVKLPLNFNSPYKSADIIEFWRRWHMTLSSFLRDYLYIPLGGNRKGPARRYLNLMITMVLGGLWHGAGWTFLIWGALHGVYLMINHGFRALARTLGWDLVRSGRAGIAASGLLTFLSVVVAWIFFRADSIASAVTLLRGMTGAFGLRGQTWLPATQLDSASAAEVLLAGLAIIWMLPNSQEILRASQPVLNHVTQPENWTRIIVLRPNWRMAPLSGLALATTVLLMSPNRVSEFLYYQF